MRYKYYSITILLISVLGTFVITSKIIEEDFEIAKNLNPKNQNTSNKKIKPATKDIQSLLRERLDVSPPFTPQAPSANWNDPRFQDGCEETASLMAVYWALDKILTPEIAKNEILAIAKYQADNFGEHHDTSIQDTVTRIINGYFDYKKAKVLKNITIQNIIDEINKNNLVIIPANGQALKNPYFTPPGPERHNLVIHGYDEKNKKFITHDPGTKRGKNYSYDQDILFNAIRDYPSGYHIDIKKIEKSIIIVWK